MAYVSVYTGRFREINRVSIIYGLVFVGIFLLLHVVERIFLPQADPFLLPIAALLAAIGLTEIFRIKPSLALAQGQWLMVGAGLFIVTVLVVRDHMKLDHYRYLIGAIGLALLIVTIVLGTTVNGAKLWIRAFGFSIQPSEFAKLAIVVFLAGYLDDKKVLLSVPDRHVLGVPFPAPKYLGPLLIMWVLSLAMLVFMKDFGMALLFMSIFVALMYMATARIVYVVTGVGLFAVAGATRRLLRARTSTTASRSGWTRGRTRWAAATSCCSRSSRSPTAASLGAGFGTGLPAVWRTTRRSCPSSDRLHLRGHRQRAGAARRRAASCWSSCSSPGAASASPSTRPTASPSCSPPAWPRRSRCRRSSSSAASRGSSRSPASRCRSSATAAARVTANLVLVALSAHGEQPHQHHPRRPDLERRKLAEMGG